MVTKAPTQKTYRGSERSFRAAILKLRELVAPLDSGATSSRRISIAARIDCSGPRYFLLRVSMRGWVRAPIHAFNINMGSRPGRALPYRVVNLTFDFNHKLKPKYLSCGCNKGTSLPFILQIRQVVEKYLSCRLKKGTLEYLPHPINLVFGCRD